MWDLRCRLLRVKDGDTVELYVDRGREDFSNEAHRLFGVYAPEKKQPGGTETTEYVRRWFEAHDDGSPWPFIVTTLRTRSDSGEITTLGRYVSMITTRDQRFSLNVEVADWLRTQGYGTGIGQPPS